VEIDEDEHMCRTLESELNHLGIIYKGLNMPPLVVIRINPDGKEPIFVEKYKGAPLDKPAKHKGTHRHFEPVWYPSKHFQKKLDIIIDRVLPIYQPAMSDELPECLASHRRMQLSEHMHHLEDMKVHQELFFFEKRERQLEQEMSNKKMRVSMEAF
jgi:hypothetical protein